MNERYILCRPIGGLNDSLCQIDTCWRYAIRYGRTLVIDFGENRLYQELFQMLEVVKSEIPVVLSPKPRLLRQLDQLDTFPPEVQGRLDTYQAVAVLGKDPNKRFDALSGADLSFPLNSDHEATVLIHHRGGGGSNSLSALNRLEVRSDVMEKILAQIRQFPERYDAVHVRNTDYLTDYPNFLRRVAKKLSISHLLVCSDDNEVLHFAEALIGPNIAFSLGDHPALEGEPLHQYGAEQSRKSARTAALRLLTEMFALTRAQRIHITTIKTRNHLLRPRFSGFTELVVAMAKSRTSAGFWRHENEELFLKLPPVNVYVHVRVVTLALLLLFRFRKRSRRQMQKLLRLLTSRVNHPAFTS